MSAASLLLRPAEAAGVGDTALLAAASAFAATAASLSGPGWGGSGRSRALLSRLVRRWKGMTKDLQIHTGAMPLSCGQRWACTAAQPKLGHRGDLQAQVLMEDW